MERAGALGAVTLGLNLEPFGGIAFLRFMGVFRDRVGEREDRFFATDFLVDDLAQNRCGARRTRNARGEG